MITTNDVYTQFLLYSDLDDLDEDTAMIYCEHGLDWIRRHLKDDADEDDSRLAVAASALAHFYLFSKRITETDRYSSYTAGDMTVKRSLSQDFELETQMRDHALAQIYDLLKDGGFYFGSH
ncbi:MAG: hypothetical protein R3Y27_00480 [Clostridia bacterium]